MGDTTILEEADVQAPGSPEKEEDLHSTCPSLGRRLYRDRRTPTSTPTPDPMEVIKMMGELILAKGKLEKRMAKMSRPHP